MLLNNMFGWNFNGFVGAHYMWYVKTTHHWQDFSGQNFSHIKSLGFHVEVEAEAEVEALGIAAAVKHFSIYIFFRTIVQYLT